MEEFDLVISRDVGPEDWAPKKEIKSLMPFGYEEIGEIPKFSEALESTGVYVQCSFSGGSGPH